MPSMATPTSNKAMSMYWPKPDFSRLASAARMAMVEYMPVMMSVTATPTFCGPPPGSSSRSPVMLINPPIPWIRTS